MRYMLDKVKNIISGERSKSYRGNKELITTDSRLFTVKFNPLCSDARPKARI